ncbi:hypothetical protein F5Y13DRAFT_195086 [Hypoxylon sp. FL1857]|nr:hypothetical protein F5Y13DRAFT_195086 [Hypoxylon sp. FL1857]
MRSKGLHPCLHRRQRILGLAQVTAPTGSLGVHSDGGKEIDKHDLAGVLEQPDWQHVGIGLVDCFGFDAVKLLKLEEN